MTRSLLFHPIGPLLALALFTGLAFWAYDVSRMALSPLAEGLLSLAWLVVLVLWMEGDARRRGQVPCFDFGLLAALLFPVSLVWYCLWTRGWRGLLLLLGLVGLYVSPGLVAFALVGLMR
jgi:hypothetical protein